MSMCNFVLKWFWTLLNMSTDRKKAHHVRQMEPQRLPSVAFPYCFPGQAQFTLVTYHTTKKRMSLDVYENLFSNTCSIAKIFRSFKVSMIPI